MQSISLAYSYLHQDFPLETIPGSFNKDRDLSLLRELRVGEAGQELSVSVYKAQLSRGGGA